MNGLSATSYALLGIQRGLEGAKRNAADIASADQFSQDNPVSLAQSMVELKQNSLQVKASAKAFEIISSTIGTLINVKV